MEGPEKKTGVHQFVDLSGPHGYQPSWRRSIELLVAGAILVISIAMMALGEASTRVHTPPPSQASCASARARELGISPAAVRREYRGEDLCSFSFGTGKNRNTMTYYIP